MAYSIPEFGSSACATPTKITARLEKLERAAVLVSRNDGIRSVRTPRSTDWVLALVYGSDAGRSFANERLEALRRYAVIRRIYGECMDQREGDHAIAAGITAPKLAIVRQLVDPWHASAPKLAAGYPIIMMVAVIGIGALWLPSVKEVIGDHPISALTLGLVSVACCLRVLVQETQR